MRTRMIAAALAILAGCGSGAGPGPQVDATRAPWQLVDLETGAATALAAAPDLADPALSDRLMLFRHIAPAEHATIGQAAGTFARQDDEVLSSAPHPAAYIAVFETTRAQWQRLAGTSPWTATAIAAIDTGSGSALPATGLGLEPVSTALAAWNGRHDGRLALPDAVLWEAAARAGSSTTFAWGEERSLAVTRLHAVTWECAVAGPQPVGGRQANALGLQDLAGNAWELTSDGWARGGSWLDGLALARPANRREVPEDGWATVGVRLTWRP